VKIRRHDKQHFVKQENKNNTAINNEREIEEDSNNGQVTSQN
jgi:hypothetical protein